METVEKIKELTTKYRGINPEHLDKMNPCYSCVICKGRTPYVEVDGKIDNSTMITCKNCGDLNGSCPDHTIISEEEFAARYNF
mgnify:CR=1 FL=1